MLIGPYGGGGVFEPEIIDSMAAALAGACEALGLKNKENVLVRLLAERIIDEARQGIHRQEGLKAAALRGLAPARRN